MLSTGSEGTTSYYESRAEESALERNAAMSLIEAEEASKEIQREGEAMLGTERTLFAKAGVDPTKGSPLAVQEETAKEIQYQKAKVKWSGMEQARMYKWGAKMAKKKGDVALASAITSTTMNIIQIVASAIGGGMGAGGAAGTISGGGAMGAAAGAVAGSMGQGGTFLSNLFRSGSGLSGSRRRGYGMSD